MSFFDWVIKIFSEYWRSFLRGTGNTLLMAIIGTVAGFLIGLIIAIIRTVPMKDSDSGAKKAALKVVNAIFSVYVEVVRGTPMMVQALIIYYSLFVPLNVAPMVSAIIIISVNTGAYMAEIVRGGIMSIDRGQTEGALSIGMTHRQTMVRVILPQVIRNILPSVSNEFVINIKDTSVLNVIGVTELYYFADVIKRQNFKQFQTYVIVCAIYFVLTFTVTRLLRLLERRLEGRNSYTVFGSQTDPDAEIHIKTEG